MNGSNKTSRGTHGGIYAGHGDRGHVVLGIFVLLAGILFLLQNLGILYIRNIWQFWPLILIGVGTAHMLDSHTLRGRFWGMFILMLGLFFLANSLGYLPWDIWRLFWPAVLIFWGLAILARALGGRRWDRPEASFNEPSTISDNVLHEEVVFGGINRKVDAKDFQGGKASAVFGGIEIDLRGAATTREEMFVEANSVFGGVELKVPETWEVVVRGSGVLGGYEDKTHSAPAVEGVKRPRLIVRGEAVFGGVTVRN
jgi:predicted membrane protein